VNYLILIIVAIISFLLGKKVSDFTQVKNKTIQPAKDKKLVQMRAESRKTLKERTKKRKDLVFYLISNQSDYAKNLISCGITKADVGVTSADIEKLLDVSSSTALRYLNELEKEGKIKQIGESGPDVYYTTND